jgi:hypothetical protein
VRPRAARSAARARAVRCPESDVALRNASRLRHTDKLRQFATELPRAIDAVAVKQGGGYASRAPNGQRLGVGHLVPYNDPTARVSPTCARNACRTPPTCNVRAWSNPPRSSAPKPVGTGASGAAAHIRFRPPV